MCIYVYSFIMCKKYDRLLEIRLTLRRAMDAKYINYILMSLLLDEEVSRGRNAFTFKLLTEYFNILQTH